MRVVPPDLSTSAGSAAEIPNAASSTGRKLSARGSNAHDMTATRGINRAGIWELEASGISTASLTLPRRASNTRAPVLRRISDDRDDVDRDEELREVYPVGEDT